MRILFSCCLILFVGLSFGQELAFKPKIDHPYSYDTELLVVNSGIINLGLKTAIEMRFLEDSSFSMKFNSIQIKTSGFAIDSKHPKTKADSIKISNITSRPFVFNLKQGKMTLKSPKNGDVDFKIENLLKRFGKYYNPRINSFYKHIVLKEGFSWDQADSVSNGFLDDKAANIHFHYTVKEISRKHITVHGTSTLIDDYDTTAIAVKYILDKKSALPRYTKFIAHNPQGPTVLMINKDHDFKAAGMFEEYTQIQPKLHQSLMELKGFNYYQPVEYTYHNTSLVADRALIKKTIDQFLDKLSIETFGSTTDYYLSGFLAEDPGELDPILKRTYVELKRVQFTAKNGEIIQTKRNSLIPYYSPMQIGPFHVDYYKEVPEIAEINTEMTLFSPTRKKVETINAPIDNSHYKVQQTDSTTLISFKKQLNIDYESFQFYDTQGNTLEARWIPNFVNLDSTLSADTLTKSFIEQVPKENEILYTLKFIVKKPSKISFAIFTKNLKFNYKKTFTPKASDIHP